MKARWFAPVVLAAILGLGVTFALTAQHVQKAYAATFGVDRFDDDANASACTGAPNDCSLRGAITSANNIPGDHTIILPAGTYTLTITGSGENNNATGDLDIKGNLTISGAGAATTVIDGGGIDRVLDVNFDVMVEINDVTIRNGKLINDNGGGARNDGKLTFVNSIVASNSASVEGSGKSAGGGAIVNHGTLVISSTFYSNTAADYGAVLANSGGKVDVTNSTFTGNTAGDGGFTDNWMGGIITITNSTFTGNTANAADGSMGGGAILNETDSTVVIINSTLSGNSAVAPKEGGAILNDGIITITNSTLTGNSATGNGALANNGTLTLINTIIANSISGQNCIGSSAVINGGHNIDSGTSCGWGSSSGSMSNTDPKLANLALNPPGSTETHALLPSSPATDAGDPAYCPSTDQRGVSRPVDGNGDGIAVCDIGAYEYYVWRLYLPLIMRGFSP